VARFRLGQRTIATAAASAAWEIRAGATFRPRVLSIKVTLAAAVASLFAVGRPAAIGITPTGLVFFQPEEPADPVSATQGATGWTTPPTVPAAFFEREGLPGAIGNTYLFDFGPNGLIVPAGGALVLWNLQLNSAFDVSALIDE
jgi:hypothetical protein